MNTTAQKVSGGSLKESARKIALEIERQADGRPVSIMEVCGTHTHEIARFGLKSLLPPGMKLISGPGCPVCVTPVGYIDHAVALARRKEVTIATFGDMVRVPGSTCSIEKARSAGADVRIVYSVMEALMLAEAFPSKKIVFLGVGFETTAPGTAAAVLEAQKKRLRNFFVLNAHKVMPPALDFLLHENSCAVDGFLCPGHVSTVIGARPYEFIPQKYGKAAVITGFGPLDILNGISMLTGQTVSGRPAVVIQYIRAVRPEGNPRALRIMNEVFDRYDTEWRGFGTIPQSGLRLKDRYAACDAAEKFQVDIESSREKNGCICGEILQGKKQPDECALFGAACTPSQPVGACMVSQEGACAAYYNYCHNRNQ
ncbi:hydrogenase formation protein HypD [candidate division KSB1 bacterium]